MINSKKVSGVFAIWLLLFAMFGPLASVSAADDGSCEDSYELAGSADKNRALCNERSEEITTADSNKPGCFWDTEGFSECITIPSNTADCGDCGGSAATCGKYECVGVYGASRIHNGHPGCRYDDGGYLGLGISKCVEEEATGSSTSRAEKIESNGGKCFGPNKLTCVTCGNDDDGKVECFVSGFQLPQDPQTTWKDVGSWFHGVGDPSYLVYYEAFPVGEDTAWQIKGNEMLVIALVINGVFSFLPGAGKIGAKYVTKKVAGELVEDTIEVSAREASKIAAERFSAAALEDAVEGFTKKSLRKKLTTKVLQTFSNFRFWSDADGIVTKIPKSELDNAINLIKVHEGMTFKQAFMSSGTISDTVADGYVTILKENGKSAIRNANIQARLVPEVMRNKAFAESAKTALNIYENNPAMRMYAIELYDVIDEDMGGEKDQWWDMMAKTVIAGKPSRSLAKNQALFVLFGVSYSTAWADSINGKFVSKGIDDMVLKMPFYPTQEITMAESHKYYVELIRDAGILSSTWFSQDPQRFFMASPCYADIHVTAEERTCSNIGARNEDCESGTTCNAVDNDQKQFEFCTDPAFEGDLSNCPVVEMNKIIPPEGVDADSIMPGAYFSEDYQATKMCATTNWYEWQGADKSWFFDESHLTPAVPTIRLKAIMDESKDNNFCFGGNHLWQKAAKGIIFVAQIPLSIAAAATPAGPIGVMAVGTASAFIDHAVSGTEYWPNH